MRVTTSLLAFASMLLAQQSDAASAAWPATAKDFDLVMKTLVVSSEYDGVLPTLVLDGYSTPYERVEKLPSLVTPDYQSIIVSRSVDDRELGLMRAYCSKYGTRIVYLNSDPKWTPGVVALSGATASQGKYIVFDASAAQDVSVANVLNTQGGWLSEGTTPRPVTLGDKAHTPVLRLSNVKGPRRDGGVVAFTTTTAGGCEEMHFTMDATVHEIYASYHGRMEVSTGNQYRQLSSLTLALGSMWFPWATRGIYLGKRRMFFVQQIDDVFAASLLFGATTPEEKQFRINGTSCRGNLAAMDRINAMLPKGSDYKLELAFNGVGCYQQPYEERNPLHAGLNKCLVENKERFNWVSHTWTHQHLDWKNAEECIVGGVPQDNTCPTTRDRIMEELQYNIQLMNGEEVNPDPKYWPTERTTPAGAFKWGPDQTNWSPHSFVPPEISGLVPLGYERLPGAEYPERYYSRPGNFDAFAAFEANGIKTITGDNTRPELLQSNVFWGLWSNKDTQGAAGILIIPRNAPSTPYNSHTPENMAMAWKQLGSCAFTPGPSCDSFDYTFGSCMERDGLSFVPYILQFRYDPLMFHQANMHTFDYEGEEWSLVTLYAKVALTEVLSFINKLPIVSPPMDKLGQLYRDREARDKCGLQGVIRVAGGQAAEVAVSGTGKCTAVLTFDKSAAARPNTKFVKETYGPDTTVMVPVNRDTVKASLTAPVLSTKKAVPSRRRFARSA